jgi:Tol biopolymer transport system component
MRLGDSNLRRAARAPVIAGIAALALAALAVSAGQGRAQATISHLAAQPGSPGAGSKIAFTADRPGRDAPDEIYVMNGDGSGERRVTFSTSGNSLSPSWSPNGKTIAYHDNIAPGVTEIYLVGADGSDQRQLTHMGELGLGGAAFAGWSPDGKKIAFTSLASADIYLINLDGSGLTRLTDGPASDARPAWSPDGTKIAFTSNRDASPGNPADIYVMSADGSGQPVRLTSAPGTDDRAAWSPSGQRIAFESSRDGNREIYVMNADGTDQTRRTFNDVVDANPSWSPDGQEIAFHRQLFQLPGLNLPNGCDLFAVRADGSGERQITHHAPDSFSAFASWAPGHASEPDKH